MTRLRIVTLTLVGSMALAPGCGVDLSGIDADSDADRRNATDLLPSELPGPDPGDSSASSPQPEVIAGAIPEGTVAFVPPAYVDADLDTELAPFEKVFETDAQEIARARREFNSVPITRRYRLPSGEDVVTHAEINAEYLKYRLQVVDQYEERTEDTGSAREAGRRYVDAYARSAAAAADAPSDEQLLALGEATLEAGSTDPMVRVFHTRMLMDRAESPDAQRRIYTALQELAPELDRRGYPAGVCVLVRQWMRNLARDTLRLSPKIVQRHTYEVIDSTVRLFQESVDESQQFVRLQVYYFLQDLDSEFREDLLCACLAADGVPDWQIHMLAGSHFKDLAWQHRGSGFADTVTEEGWRNFAQFLQRSAAHYTRAWYLHPELPDAAADMIAVSMGGGDQTWTPRDWFQQSVIAQLDYSTAYSNLIWAMTPRWGGSHSVQLRFAVECLETDRWDTGVPGQASEVLWSVQKELGDERPLGENPQVAEVAELFVEGLMDARDRLDVIPADTPDNLGQMAGILVQAQKYSVARRVFEADDERIVQHDFDWSSVKKSYARGLAYARTGPAAETVAIFEELLRNPLPDDVEPAVFEEFLNLIEQARTADSRPESRQYFDDIEAIVHQLQEFHAGEWAGLTFDENLSGWYAMAERIEIIDEQTAGLMSTVYYPGVQLRPMAPFPPPFQVEAEFSTWPDAASPTWVGITIGAADRRALYARDRRRSVMMSPTSTFASAVINPTGDGIDEAADLKDLSPFKLLGLDVRPGRIGFSARGSQFAEDADYPFVPTGALTFGEVLPTDDATAFQIRNVRIRRLDLKPEVTDGLTNARINP